MTTPEDPSTLPGASATVAFGEGMRALAREAAASPRCGPYEIRELLGRGGFGAVSRAVHEATGQEVALKTVRTLSRSALYGLRREIVALASLRHPGIVRIVDSGVEEGRPWYAMELVDGLPLRAWIPPSPGVTAPADDVPWWTMTRAAAAEPAATTEVVRPGGGPEPAGGQPARPGSVEQRLALIERLCEPLGYMHGERMVHRDLKPDNVIVGRDGSPVIVDFGLVEHLAAGSSRAALEVSGEVSGTIAYMAPEQIRGRPADARADLYALGCILYELLTGRPPFASETAAHMAWLHLQALPDPPSRHGAPPELDELVLRLLQKEPADRIGYAADVSRMLLPSVATAPPLPLPPSRPYLYRASLVERTSELGRIEELLDAVKSGSEGAVLHLTGESGSGKTRLLTELALQARERSFEVLAGAGAADASGRGALRAFLRPIEDVVDRCLEGGDEEARRIFGGAGRVLAEYVPRLLSLPVVQEQPAPVPLGRSQEELRLWRALGRVLETLASREPLVVMVDDLQLADDLTLGFVGYWLRTTPHPRTLLALAGRSGGPVSPPELSGSAAVTTLALARLSRDGVASMLRGMLAMSAPPDELVGLLARESEGNPFSLSEYLLSAVERGLLARDAWGRWTATGGSWQLPLPASLQELLVERLARLGATTRTFLELAAAAGRELLVPHLEAASAALHPELDVLGEVAHLVAARIVEDDGGALRFGHERLRELALQMLPGERGAAIHRALAEAADAPPLAGAVGPARRAHHWEMAGDLERARPLQLEGARAALARHDLEAAERLFRAFLRHAPPSLEKLDARHDLSTAVLMRRGRRSEAQQEAETLYAEAVAAGNGKLQVLAKRTIAQLLLDVRPQDAAAHLEEAHAVALGLGDRRLLASVFVNQGDAADIAGRTAESFALYEKARDLAAAIGDDLVRGTAVGNLSTVLRGLGRFEEAWAAAEEALAIQRSAGDRHNEMTMLGNLANYALELGKADEAIVRYEATLAIAREIGERRMEGLLLGNLGAAYHQRGDLASCRRTLEAAIAIHRETENRKSEAYVLGNLGSLLCDLGELARARELFERCLGIRASLADLRGEAFTYGALAMLERFEGRLDAAEAAVLRSIAIFEELDDAFETVRVLAELGHQELARGADPSATVARADALRPAIGSDGNDMAASRLALLRRAIAARAAGEPLHAGMAREDAPAWLVERDLHRPDRC